MIKQAVKELEGIKEIYINVEKDNKIALNFYEAKGFEIVKESDVEFDEHILKQLRMVKKV